MGELKKDPQTVTSRRIPTQRRSRERMERILQVARQLIAEQGSAHLRMSELAEQSNISIGSLYQYFPDKRTVIAALAEHYNAEGQACVQRELADVADAKALQAALDRIIDLYHQMYLDEPVMRDLWGATQVDPELQAMDAADVQAHASLLLPVLVRVFPAQDSAELQRVALLTMQMIATGVRLVLTSDVQHSKPLLETHKRLMHQGLGGLGRSV